VGRGHGPSSRSRSLRLAGVTDAVLEWSVAGSFTRIGPIVRRRLEHWADPVPRPGRVVVVTGATSGLGKEAALELGRLGCTVVLVGRSVDRLAEVKAAIEADGGTAVSEQADLSDLSQSAALADRIRARFDRLDVLIHNAGALLSEYHAGPQGHEVTVTVHVLSPYLLTERLRSPLKASDRAKVISMTSGGMYTEAFDLEKLEMRRDRYKGSVAYARAKRAQVVLARAWQRRAPDGGIDFSAVHPGWARTPGVAESLPRFTRIVGPLLRSPAEGVDTLIWLATSPPGEPGGGQLWLDRRARPLYRVPSTRVDEATELAQGEELLTWLDAATHTEN